MKDYGEFEEVVDENAASAEQAPGMGEAPTRVRMPRDGEIIGVIVQRLGGNRMDVLATDGKSRNCRVPGRYKRSLWLRPKDIVMIAPWADDPTKGDVIYKYSSSQIIQLRKKGIINSLKIDF